MNPASGLLVYQTDAPIGFYYFSQGKWKLLGEQDITMKLNIADTASMLSGYAKVQRMLDSLFAIQTRLSQIQTNINQKINISDTASMLSGYAKVSSLLDSLASVQSKLNLKLNISDTAAMLSSRIKRDTVSLSRRIDAVKTALTNYLPLTGGTLTGPLNGTSATLSGNLKSGAVTYPNTHGTSGQVLTSTGSGTLSWTTSTADAGTLTGATLNSTVTGSSLTSVGTIASLTTGAITNSGKVIVGASSAASSSAVLEASSTTQGFLPPRMSYYQRTQIASPVAGLTIWCSNCGASGEMQVFNGGEWTNMSGGTATGTISLSIGDNYQGGKVAYILVSGDPGYDANTPHGLIAATSDQSTGIRWYNGSFITTGATGTALGTGLSNTNAIISSQGVTATSYAAGLAKAYTGG